MSKPFTKEMIKTKQSNLQKIHSLFSNFKQHHNLSLEELYNLYIDAFKDYPGSEIYRYGNIENLMNVSHYYKCVYIWGFLWSSSYDLSEYFHATSVIKIVNDSDQEFYLTISHQDKGQNLISVSEQFPYSLDDFGKNIYNYSLTFITREKGGIICKGETTNVSVQHLVYFVLVWWYMNDYIRQTESFPASCTGLTETMFVLLAKPGVRETCLNFNLTSGDRSRIKKGNYPLPM